MQIAGQLVEPGARETHAAAGFQQQQLGHRVADQRTPSTTYPRLESDRILQVLLFLQVTYDMELIMVQSRYLFWRLDYNRCRQYRDAFFTSTDSLKGQIPLPAWLSTCTVSL